MLTARMKGNTVSKSVIKTLILLIVLLQIFESDSSPVPDSKNKRKKLSRLSKLFNKKYDKYDMFSKDGSLLFPALKAISDKNAPILKNVNSFDNEYDQGKFTIGQLFL